MRCAYCTHGRRPHGRFLTESFLCDSLFSAGKKSKQKSTLDRLCSSSNYLWDLAVRLCTFLTNGCKHFKVVNGISVMIGTQSRFPRRDAQLGEAVLLKSPVSPLKLQHKKTYFRGKWNGRHLSESWRDSFKATLKSLFVRLKTLAAAAFFWLLYFLLLTIFTG